MEMIMVAIKDRALDAYMRPFFAQTKGQAIRMFTDEINNKESPMQKHPDDYDLWYLGTWNDQDGQLNDQKPEQLAIGKNSSLDYVQPKLV